MVECDIKKEIWRIAPHDGLYFLNKYKNK